MWTDLSQCCLTKRLLKHFRKQQKQTTFIVIGTLRVSSIINFESTLLISYQQTTLAGEGLNGIIATYPLNLIWVDPLCKVIGSTTGSTTSVFADNLCKQCNKTSHLIWIQEFIEKVNF